MQIYYKINVHHYVRDRQANRLRELMSFFFRFVTWFCLFVCATTKTKSIRSVTKLTEMEIIRKKLWYFEMLEKCLIECV